MGIVDKILKLKKQRDAVILVHNYQPMEVQEIADYLGDSLGLSRQAAETKADVIVFCGVHFMAETASILCPGKKILLPDISAGCPMADMIDIKKVRALKKAHPKAVVVSYVNTTAEVKAESDVCCTSANAVKVVESLDAEEIIFLPDKYLGQYVASQTGKKLIFSDGYCPVHLKILPEDIKRKKERYPQAEVIVHPECTPEVTALADKILSTSGMCNYVKKTQAKEIIVATEIELSYRLQKDNPDKTIYPASQLAICPNMKKNTLEKVFWALEDMKYEVKVEEKIRIKAKKAIDKMLEFSRVD